MTNSKNKPKSGSPDEALAKSGYKQTKIGIIPEDWEVVRFDKVFRSLGGTALEKFFKDDANYKVISIGNYSKSGKYIDNGQRIVLNEKTERKKLDKSDLVMVLNDKTSSGEIIGATIYIDEDDTYIYNQRSQRIIPLQGIYPIFAWWYLNGLFRKRVFALSQGGTQIYVNFSSIEKQQLPLPPLPEQKKIAEILSTWDGAIESQQDLIKAKKELKKGLMQQLLTGKTRFKEFVKSKKFKNTKIGKVPEDWEVVRLEQTGNIVSGGTPSTKIPDYWNGDLPWATPTDLTSQNSNYIYATERNITEEGLNNSSAKLVPCNSLLICTRATVGVTTITGTKMTTNQGFKNLIPFQTVDVIYINNQIKYRKNKLISLGSGSTFIEVSKKDISGFSIPLPPLPEQQKIAEVLSAADEEIELLEEELGKLKEQKKGLMQKLLTGERRVKV